MKQSGRKYIEATYELLKRDGLNGISIRKVADYLGCSSAALYRHFNDIDHLIGIASVRFLHDYAADAQVLSKVDLNPMELNLQLWECIAFYSFKNAPIFENLFFGKGDGSAYQHAVQDYYKEYPEDLEGMKDFMHDMLTNATMIERDAILLTHAAEKGMIDHEDVDYLKRIDTYIYHGMLASIRETYCQEGVAKAKTQEFMKLIIDGYQSHLKPGYTILTVSPEKPILSMDKKGGSKQAYQIKLIPLKQIRDSA